MCRLRNIALESVTDGRTDGQMDRRTTDKVIPMCHYASQATQKLCYASQATQKLCSPVDLVFITNRSLFMSLQVVVFGVLFSTGI